MLHPLDPLTEDELRDAVRIVRAARDPEGRMRFVSIQLLEPSKEIVTAWAPSLGIDRAAELVILDPSTESAFEAVVSITEGALVSWNALQGLQPAIMPEEYEEVERLVKAHPDFVAALERRSVSELDLVCVDPVPPGAWATMTTKGAGYAERWPGYAQYQTGINMPARSKGSSASSTCTDARFSRSMISGASPYRRVSANIARRCSLRPVQIFGLSRSASQTVRASRWTAISSDGRSGYFASASTHAKAWCSTRSGTRTRRTQVDPPSSILLRDGRPVRRAEYGSVPPLPL